MLCMLLQSSFGLGYFNFFIEESLSNDRMHRDSTLSWQCAHPPTPCKVVLLCLWVKMYTNETLNFNMSTTFLSARTVNFDTQNWDNLCRLCFSFDDTIRRLMATDGVPECRGACFALGRCATSHQQLPNWKMPTG